ncbi:hypothetical protein WCLP8_3270004 [uncultured Gammaproteobacteria bacterium]
MKAITILISLLLSQAVSSDGASGKVVLLSGGQKVEIPLKPAGTNRLSGSGSVAGGDKVSAVVTVERVGGSLSVRIPASH